MSGPTSMTILSALSRAMAYRARKGDTAAGAAQAALRRAILASIRDPVGSPPLLDVLDARDGLKAIQIEDMPPPVDMLSLLVDTIAMRHGYTTRAEAWRHIGINPNRGRSLLGQNAQAIDWPIWRTARDAAIGGD